MAECGSSILQGLAGEREHLAWQLVWHPAYEIPSWKFKEAEENRYVLVEILLEYGADVDAKSDYGRTALMSAAEKGRIDLMELLLARGADINACTIRSESILMRAIKKGRPEAAVFFSPSTARMSICGTNGGPPP